MTLRLVHTDNDRALAIRDHILPLLRANGSLEDAPTRVLRLECEPGWMFAHWTPFNALSPKEASSPGYRHAVARQRTGPDLPYGLDICLNGAKVFSILWDDGGALKVLRFRRGAWEEQALRL